MYSAKGRITRIDSPTSGISKTGNQWVRQGFVLETIENNALNHLYFDMFNAEFGYGVGSDVEVVFNITSREYNGKFYTNLKVVEIKTGVQAPMSVTYSQPSAAPTQAPAQQQQQQFNNGEVKDLPF